MAADAADAELVLLRERQHGPGAATQGELLQLVLLVQVRRGLGDPGRRDPHDEEREHHDAPALELLEQRGLERRVGGPGFSASGMSGPVSRVRWRSARPAIAAAVIEGARDREDDPRGGRERQHRRRRAYAFLIPAPRRRRPAAAARSCPCPRAGPRTTSDVSTITRPSTTSMWKRSIPRGAGRAGTRRPRCTWSRGTGTRTTSTTRRTAPGTPGARSAGTAA